MEAKTKSSTAENKGIKPKSYQIQLRNIVPNEPTCKMPLLLLEFDQGIFLIEGDQEQDRHQEKTSERTCIIHFMLVKTYLVIIFTVRTSYNQTSSQAFQVYLTIRMLITHSNIPPADRQNASVADGYELAPIT